MKTYYYLVLTRAAPGKEDEFHKWYDEQHLPDCMKVPGVVSAKRFKIENEVGPSTEGSQVLKAPYDAVAIYEFETDDPVAVARELSARAGTDAMVMTEAVDRAASIKYVATAAGEV